MLLILDYCPMSSFSFEEKNHYCVSVITQIYCNSYNAMFNVVKHLMHEFQEDILSQGIFPMKSENQILIVEYIMINYLLLLYFGCMLTLLVHCKKHDSNFLCFLPKFHHNVMGANIMYPLSTI